MAEPAPPKAPIGTITPRPLPVQQISIPFMYFNGFEVSSSFSDMGLLLLVDGQPLVRLGMSFTTAKTLAQNLSNGVTTFEKMTEHNIMTMEQVQNFVEKKGK